MVRSKPHEKLTWLLSCLIASLGGPFATASLVLAGESKGFMLSPGFQVERVVADGVLRFPMFAAFDDQGRLYVTESSGLDLYAELSAGTRRCRISRLEDRDGDGHYESSVVFANRLVFPMGIAWRNGVLYVADPPDLITLRDIDGDGQADERKTILTGFGHKDNGSLHGLIFGPDGLLTMTMGMPDGYRLPRGDGTWLEGNSGAWIRCRPDGSHPEVVSRGFVNLVEIAFMPDGEAIGTDNWFQEPAGGIRDALVHLVDGGLYPYVPDSGTQQPVTGPALPALSVYPAVALSGLARLEGPSLPAAFQGNLVSAQHNTRSVGRHVLVPQGATFRSEDSVLLSAEDPDFHPADVLIDGDGSILVIDTGAWYVQHCPTGRIRAADSKGGVFRLRWSAAKRVNDSFGRALDLAAMSPEQLTAKLVDQRPALRARIRHELAARGRNSLKALAQSLTSKTEARVRLDVVWTLCELDDPGVSPLLRQVLADTQLDVACAATKVIALRQDATFAPDLVRCVHTGPARLRRGAAEALARCGNRTTLPVLWSSIAKESDPHLRHSLAFAIHHHASEADLAVALERPEPRIQEVALTLLDQPPRPRGVLRPDELTARLASTDSRLRSSVISILARHPEWAPEVTPHLKRELSASGVAADCTGILTPLIRAWLGRPEVVSLLAEMAGDRNLAQDRRIWAVEMMGQSAASPLPDSWVRVLNRLISDVDSALRRQAVNTAAMLNTSRLDDLLARLSENTAEAAELRLAALRVILPRRPVPTAPGFELISRLLSEPDPARRLTAASAVGMARLDDSQRMQVLHMIRGDPLITPDLVSGSFKSSPGIEVSDRWMSYLESAVSSGWRPEASRMDALLKNLENVPQHRRDALRARLDEWLKQRTVRLREMLPLVPGGDSARGRAIFNGTKVGCASCHRIGNVGGQVGPELTRIGLVRSGEDLLESILFPSASYAQGYEPYNVALDDGRVIQGVISRQDESQVVIREASGTEIRLPRGRIEELQPSASSIMPEGVAQSLTSDELRDLLAFLQSLK